MCLIGGGSSFVGKSLPTWHDKEEESVQAENPEKPENRDRSLRSIKSFWPVVGLLKKKNTSAFWTSQRNIGSKKAVSTSSRSGTSIPSHEAPFGLLDLPRELRDQIYDFSICDYGTDPCKYDINRLATRPLFYNLEYNACILATNHQIQHEFSRVLCLRKAKSAVPAVMTVVTEKILPETRGPYYCHPIPMHTAHLKFLSPCVQFLQSVNVHIHYYPIHTFTRFNSELCNVTPPNHAQIHVINPLIAALENGENLRSVRIRLSLSGGKFELDWVSREIERFKAIRGFEIVQLEVVRVMNRSTTLTDVIWAVPRDGEPGWSHLEFSTDAPWKGPHRSGRDFNCLECWREAQEEEFGEFPNFKHETPHDESFLKMRRWNK